MKEERKDGGRQGERERRKEGYEIMSGSDSAMKNYQAGQSEGVEEAAGLCAILDRP